MPKIRTNKAAKKRFSRTASGRLKRNHAYHRHQLTSKTRKRKRKLGGTTLVDLRDGRRVDRLLPGKG
jgi:large subunit ribosomal protein L35